MSGSRLLALAALALASCSSVQQSPSFPRLEPPEVYQEEYVSLTVGQRSFDDELAHPVTDLEVTCVTMFVFVFLEPRFVFGNLTSMFFHIDRCRFDQGGCSCCCCSRRYLGGRVCWQ